MKRMFFLTTLFTLSVGAYSKVGINVQNSKAIFNVNTMANDGFIVSQVIDSQQYSKNGLYTSDYPIASYQVIGIIGIVSILHYSFYLYVN